MWAPGVTAGPAVGDEWWLRCDCGRSSCPQLARCRWIDVRGEREEDEDGGDEEQELLLEEKSLVKEESEGHETKKG